MKYKLVDTLNKPKRLSPRNPLDIPTKEIYPPLTSGYEVYTWLKSNCFLTERYKFRGRARGKGWYDSMPLNTAERIALYIDEKDDYQSKVIEQHKRCKAIDNIQQLVSELNRQVDKYEEIYDDRVHIKNLED